MDCCIVIPARMGATRFPGKPLVDLLGKPMVQWVWEAAVASGVGSRIVVATPDQEILDACRGFGAEAMLTRADHPSGTDRVAEVATQIRADYYLNVQGDEPLMPPASIAACARPMTDADCMLASVYTPCSPEEEGNPAVVKVVLQLDETALYFSRHAIPFPRAPRIAPLWKHVGLYAYRPEALEAFSRLAPTPLEQTEGLEQLRFLENGFRFRMARGEGSPLAVDTPEQAEEVRDRLRAAGSRGAHETT